MLRVNNLSGFGVLGEPYVPFTITSFGPAYDVGGAIQTNTSLARLTNTTFLVVYANDLNKGSARVLSVDGDIVTSGSEHEFLNVAAGAYFEIGLLSPTKAIISWRNPGPNYYGQAVVLQISGSTVTSPTSDSAFKSAIVAYPDITALSDTLAIATYGDVATSKGEAKLLLISGTSFSNIDTVIFNNGATNYTKVTKISDTQVLVTYQDSGNSEKGTACILTVTKANPESGSTISAGPEYIFNNAVTTFIVSTVLSPTMALVSYNDGGNSGYGTACALAISGTTIIPGGEHVYYSGNTETAFTIAAMNNKQAFITFTDASGRNFQSNVLTVDDTDSTVTDEGTTQITTVQYDGGLASACKVSDKQALIVYEDHNNANNMTGRTVNS